MRWDGISEFVYVTEYESFTRAAKSRNICSASQPTDQCAGEAPEH